PAFERILAWIVGELRHFLRRRDHHFLHDLLRLGFSQPGFERRGMDEPPIRIEEHAPTLLIAHVLEPGEQALARRDGIGVVHNSINHESARISIESWRPERVSRFETPTIGARTALSARKNTAEETRDGLTDLTRGHGCPRTAVAAAFFASEEKPLERAEFVQTIPLPASREFFHFPARTALPFPV